jgi:hypothetical protein
MRAFTYVLLFLLAIASGTLLAIIDVQRVEAWQGNLQPCSVLNGIDTSTVVFENGQNIREFISDESNLGSVPPFDQTNPRHSMMVASTQANGGMTITWEVEGTISDPDNILMQEQNNGNRRIRIPEPFHQITVNYDVNDEHYDLPSSIFTDNGTGNFTIGSYTCMSFNNNLEYDNDYTGVIYDEVFDPIDDCDTLDIGCQIGNIFSQVSNTFLAVGRAIVEGIASLFVPNSDVMATIFNQMRTDFEDNLGFLVFPITFIIDLFTTLQNSPACGNDCTLISTTWLGGQLDVDPLVFRDFIPNYYALVINIIRAATVFTLMMVVYRKYLEVVKG